MTLLLYDKDLKAEHTGVSYDDVRFDMFKPDAQKAIRLINDLGYDALFQSTHHSGGPKLIALS